MNKELSEINIIFKTLEGNVIFPKKYLESSKIFSKINKTTEYSQLINEIGIKNLLIILKGYLKICYTPSYENDIRVIIENKENMINPLCVREVKYFLSLAFNEEISINNELIMKLSKLVKLLDIVDPNRILFCYRYNCCEYCNEIICICY